jgi:hypothetical protein
VSRTPRTISTLLTRSRILVLGTISIIGQRYLPHVDVSLVVFRFVVDDRSIPTSS